MLLWKQYAKYNGKIWDTCDELESGEDTCGGSGQVIGEKGENSAQKENDEEFVMQKWVRLIMGFWRVRKRMKLGCSRPND